MAFIGAGLGVFVQSAPWGNGFFAAGHFVGCVAGVLLIYSFLRRLMPRLRWTSRFLAIAVVGIAFSAIGYSSARPSPEKALPYMIGRSLPSNLRCDFLRCKWYDGQIYIARFRTDHQGIQAILSARKYEVIELRDEVDYVARWPGIFMFARIADPSWREAPSVSRPRMFTWMSENRASTSRSESAALLIDDDTGDCWLAFDWT